MVLTTENKATRIPPRQGSFADLEDEESLQRNHPLAQEQEQHLTSSSSEQPVRLSTTTTAINSPSTTNTPSSLRDENEELRRQIQDLQAQMSYLRHHYHTQAQLQEGKRNKAASSPGVVLELPLAMKKTSMISSPLNCLRDKNPTPKDHQSFATDDDQSTIEPTSDWDAHESSAGLKHRNSTHLPVEAPRPPKRRNTPFSTSTNSPTDNATRRTEPLSQGSFLSEEGSEVHSSSEGEDYEDVDMESRELIRHHTSTSEARPTTVASRTAQEEESMWSIVSDRAGWLVGLLVLQSMSSFIIGRNEALLQRHLVIVRFLTMLVGAGGNAGNQASVRVIRGLAVGTIDSSNQRRFLKREFMMGFTLSCVLGVAGCIRAAVFLTPWLETLAITTSLFMIVSISIILGALLPLGMQKVGIDPAHSSTTIQVIMDILGVSITVWMSSLILDSGLQDFLTSAFVEA